MLFSKLIFCNRPKIYLQRNYTKGNLAYTHNIHYVIWKNIIHVILLWNPCPIFKISILPFSLHQGKWQENNLYGKSSVNYPFLLNPFGYLKL